MKYILFILFLLTQTTLTNQLFFPLIQKHPKNQLSSILGLLGELQSFQKAFTEKMAPYYLELAQLSESDYDAYLEKWSKKIINKIYSLELSTLPNNNHYKQKIATELIKTEIQTGIPFIDPLKELFFDSLLHSIKEGYTTELLKKIKELIFLKLCLSETEWNYTITIELPEKTDNLPTTIIDLILETNL